MTDNQNLHNSKKQPIENFFTRSVRWFLVSSVQIVLTALCFWFAVYLRYGFEVPRPLVSSMLPLLGIYSGLAWAAFNLTGFDRGWFRYVGMFDVTKLWLVLLTHVGISYLVLKYLLPDYFPWLNFLPHSSFPIVFFIEGVIFSIWRISFRMFHDLKKASSSTKRSLAIVGSVGDLVGLVRLFRSSTDFTVRAIITNDRSWSGSAVDDVPIFSPIKENIKQIVERYDVKDLILQDGSVSEVRELIDALPSDVRILRMPNIDRLVRRGALLGTELRPYTIEDLVSRKTHTKASDSLESTLNGKTIFITGAGGSIGSEISRQVARTGCKKIILLDHSENNLFLIQEELKKSKNIVPLLIDLRDVEDVNRALDEHRPDIVIHAAAFKHVGMMEIKPKAAFENNVVALLNLVKKSNELPVEYFINISTDKAARPSSVMGLSKSIGEHLVSFYSRKNAGFKNVRFGNVLGSNGSVVPIFQKQIAAGGPVTVTDPRMTRFLMTIPEACHLVLETLTFSNQISGDVHMIKMGDPVSILKLAETMVRLSGLRPYEDIPIEFVGIRDGEKLHEVLYDSQTESVESESEHYLHIKTDVTLTNRVLDMISELQEGLDPTRSISRDDLFKVYYRYSGSKELEH